MAAYQEASKELGLHVLQTLEMAKQQAAFYTTAPGSGDGVGDARNGYGGMGGSRSQKTSEQLCFLVVWHLRE